MPAPILPNDLLKRQTDLTVAPTASGIHGSVVLDTLAGTAGGTLAFDASAADNGVTQAPVPLAATLTDVTTTQTATVIPTPTIQSSPDAAPSSSASSAPSKDIPIGIVVGACLGALAGCILLILIGFYIYKRSAPKRRARQPMSATRNYRGDLARSRSKLEDWNKLDEGEDKWEAKYQTKEVSPVALASTEKLLTMKNSPPSIRTVAPHVTQNTEEKPSFSIDSHPFSQYQPTYNVTPAPAPPISEERSTPQYLGQLDTGPALTWDNDMLKSGSFLTLNTRISGAMSPTFEPAVRTPNLTSSQPHRWESAEVVDYEEVVEEKSNNPFSKDYGDRTSAHNPFFNAQDPFPPRIPKALKGKEREILPANPYGGETPAPSIPEIKQHSAEGSISSKSDRALANLIAALDLSPEEVQERLRVASMQPSIISVASAYTNDTVEVTDSFPLPPGSNH